MLACSVHEALFSAVSTIAQFRSFFNVLDDMPCLPFLLGLVLLLMTHAQMQSSVIKGIIIALTTCN